MRVVVIGAGVGGLALARGLVERGVEVEVHERGDRLRTGGAGPGLYSNGVAALNELGVDIDDLGRRIDALEVRDHRGRTSLSIDVASVAGRLGFECRTVPRRFLLERLAQGLPEGVVRFGRVCTGVRPRADGRVSAVFDDGDLVTGDVVVGADGVESVVRAALWGEEPWGAGRWASWQALTAVDLPRVEGTLCSVSQGRQGMCGIMPAGEGLVQWWFDVRWRRGLPATAKPVPVLRELFASWTDPDVCAVLEQAGDGDPELFPHVRNRVLPEWGKGATTLMGDAAHAFPPSAAQGANQALEDAWALTMALGDSTARFEPDMALRRYEEVRRRPAALASFTSGLEAVVRVRPPALLGQEWLGDLATRQFAGYLSEVSNVLTGSRP